MQFEKECRELPTRIIAYLNFIHEPQNQNLYLNLINRTVPIGFENCNPSWWKTLPKYKTEDLNINCKYRIDKILNSLHISQESESAQKYIKIIRLLDRIGIEKCPPQYQLTLLPNN